MVFWGKRITGSAKALWQKGASMRSVVEVSDERGPLYRDLV